MAKGKAGGAERQMRERDLKREFEKYGRAEKGLRYLEMAVRMYELASEIIVFTSGIYTSGFSSHLAAFKPELASISRRWRFTRTDAQKAGLSTPVPSTR